MAESWFATYKAELVDPGVWPTVARLRTATFDYIEVLSTANAVTPPLGISARPATNSVTNTPQPKRHNLPVRQNGARPVQRRVQVDGAVPDVVMRGPLGGAGQ